MLSDASDETEEKSGDIYEAYRDALATFGAEPEPLLRSSGLGVNGLLDWMLKEFAVLGNILTNISDNSAVISCENAFALLKREGCQDLGQDCRSRVSVPGVFRVGSLLWQDSICEKGFSAKVLVICWTTSFAGYRPPMS